jgi:hypothetical protein
LRAGRVRVTGDAFLDRVDSESSGADQWRVSPTAGNRQRESKTTAELKQVRVSLARIEEWEGSHRRARTRVVNSDGEAARPIPSGE